MHSIGLFLILSIPYLVSSEVLVHPQSTTVVNHETVNLSCVFRPPIEGCYWLKDDGVVEIEHRYRYTGDFNDGNCSIVISNIREEDGGQWTCGSPQTSSGTLGLKSKPALINVIVPPTVTFSYHGIQLDNGQKLYFQTTQEMEDLMCSVKTQLKADQINVKWLAKTSNVDSSPRPLSISVKQLTYSKNVNYIYSVINANKLHEAGNAKRIVCHLLIKDSNQVYETYVRIIQPSN